MSTWDAARLASRRQLPKPRKMMGPYSTLGEPKWSAFSGNLDCPDAVCSACGHHVCSCEPVVVHMHYHNPGDYRFPVLVHRVVTDDGDAVEFYR